MDSFDVMSSDHFHVILHPNKKDGLMFNRLDGTFDSIDHDDAKELSNLKLVNRVHGIVGHFLDKYLVLIKNQTSVGTLYEPITKIEHEIFKITQVEVIEVSNFSKSSNNSKADSVRYDTDANRECSESAFINKPEENSTDPMDYSSLPISINSNRMASYQQRSVQWNPFKLANNLRPMVPNQFLKSTIGSSTSSSSQDVDNGFPNRNNQYEDGDKRLVDEMCKLFNNTDSFYYSPTLDLTNRLSIKASNVNLNESIWLRADKRFFWNKHMLKDLIKLSEVNKNAGNFICVILQGFIGIQSKDIIMKPLEKSSLEKTKLDFFELSNNNCDNTSKLVDFPNSKQYQLALISRRSVFQAGTRYRRRGCDEKGDTANFVETEQIFRFNNHFKSVILLRGSIPLFWYQTGYNYRPPPVMMRSDADNQSAFEKHFENLIATYGTDGFLLVDCTENTGREKALHYAYKSHVEQLNRKYEKIKLIEFDFHKHCRGRQCSDALIEKHLELCGLDDKMMKDARYYWNDGDVVLTQRDIFRVNCLDCSDRTNVVQRAIALKILDFQLARLGFITPDTKIEENEFRRIMQVMWSSNGNVLSTQYCGTRALFGGAGERKISGYLKDTYSSASRYYISKFRDAYRQAAIDAMLGVENVDNCIENTEIKDQYELPSFDPLLAGRSGGALLRDVGNRVSNRIARLKGRFYTGSIGLKNINFNKNTTTEALDIASSAFVEDNLNESLGALDIDWPSTESVNNPAEHNQDVFARFSNNDDNFQDDDEFGQLLLSIDMVESKCLRDNEMSKDDNVEEKQPKPEEISMTESCGLKLGNQTGNPIAGTSTTTT